MPGPDGIHSIAEEHALQLTRLIPFIPDQSLQPLKPGLLSVGVHQRMNAGHPGRSFGLRFKVRPVALTVGTRP